MLNDFYTVSHEEHEENNWKGNIIFNAAHDIFKGHFPGQPVVPGVCLMQIIREQLNQLLQSDLMIKAAPQIKFLQLITPDMQPSLSIEWKNENGRYRVSATYTMEKALNKMSLELVKNL